MQAADDKHVADGWHAGLELGFQYINNRTVLARRQRHGPLAVQRPFYPEGEVCHVYLLHPPGGVVGGDQLQIRAELAEQSRALITTPGATKFYRSAQQLARQVQLIKVAEDACVEWLPQENIYFPGAEVNLQTRIELQGNARVAMWETHCFGRPTLEERFDAGQVDSGLQIWRDGKPLLIERLHADAGRSALGSNLRNLPVTATLVMNNANNQALEMAREYQVKDDDQVCAATLIEGLLVVRYLGRSTEMARRLFVATWSALRARLINKPAVIPRIWST
jgi:urease accessory protein